MNGIQGRINKSADTNEQLDVVDASINYKHFKNIPEKSEIESNIVDEFRNPLFRLKEEQTHVTKEDYDKLSFNRPSSQINERKISPRPSPEIPKKYIKPKPEEIEMGVKNYGYANDQRPHSWESNLSAINPYAVDTPMRNTQLNRPPSVGMEISESSTENRLNSIATQSDYSSINDVNPYLMTQDKGPQYEDLGNMRAKMAVAKTTSGNKKANMIYEPAVINEKGHSYVKRTSIDAGFDDHSNYCSLVFTILVGILAIIALVVVFLLVFGVVSAKKCKECEVTNPAATPAPLTGAQKQQQKDTELQLQYLKRNLTVLQKILHANASGTIKILQAQLDEQKLSVTSLKLQLAEQRQRTNSLNVTTTRLQGVQKAQINLVSKMVDNKMERAALIFKQNISHLKQIVHNINSTNIQTMNTHREQLETLIDGKVVDKANFTKLKEEVVSQNVVFFKKMALNVMKYNRLNSSLRMLGANINQTIETKVSSLYEYAGRIRQNLTDVTSQMKNRTVTERPYHNNRSSFSSCKFETNKQWTTVKGSSPGQQVVSVLARQKQGSVIIGASCSGTANNVTLSWFHKPTSAYMCLCKGELHKATEMICLIYYWDCPI